MAMIIASHIVKPSSPTPNTFKKHYLSTLDQIAPPVYLTLIFFYENNHSKQHEEILRRLKQSLSETLTVFYPLAGRMNGNSFVDCDDSGAVLVEARVHGCLSQFKENPKMEELERFLPIDDSSSPVDNPVLSVKATYFDCGGVAVAVCFPHKLGDTSSFSTFMHAWAATCRGEASRIIRPAFDLALRFPARESLSSGVRLGISGEKMVTRRLVFEREEVEKLRKEASRSEVKDPSRVEAVSSFLWQSFIEVHKKVDKETTSFPTSHMVNMRRRAVPPVPDHAFGNCFTLALAFVSKEEEEEEEEGDDGVLVSRLRAAIRGVDEDYINAISDDGFVEEVLGQIGDFLKAGNCVFTSWLRFPLYEVDFGWGKPVRVCTATMPYMNLVVLMDTPSGDGIEAWVNVRDDDFFELLQASCNKNLDRLT